MRWLLIIWIGIAFGLQFTYAQSCCSGGVPVSTHLGFESSLKGSLQVSLSIDFNFLRSLYSEKERLTDNFRHRLTRSYIVRAAYSLSNHWTVEAFLPVIHQQRIIRSTIASDKESSFGVGDPFFLTIYDITTRPIVFRAGIGTKIPLGGYQYKNDSGLFLSEDLQPGSGTWDLLLFNSVIYSFPNHPSASVFTNVIISKKGTNPNSRNGAQSYKFGNDIQIIGGISDQLNLFNQIISPGLSLRYRKAARDEVDGIPNSGTGGKFLFLRLSNGMALPRNGGNLLLNIEWPIFVKVNETQLAPSLSFNLGWIKNFDNPSSSMTPESTL